VAAFRAAGLRVAIGTDGRGSNPDLSVLGECRTLVDAGLVSPAEALAMATREAAWALMLERTSGRIAVGRPADLVVLRPKHGGDDPAAAALDPTTRVAATLRAGRIIAVVAPSQSPSPTSPFSNSAPAVSASRSRTAFGSTIRPAASMVDFHARVVIGLPSLRQARGSAGARRYRCGRC
jgi:hypothetical protein